MTILIDLFPRTFTARRYVSLNAYGCLTCSLERSGHFGHGYESSETLCGGMLDYMHKKAKKSNSNWKCTSCGKVYKAINILEELPDS